MKERVDLTVTREEKQRYEQMAARAGLSLSEWLRRAANEKLAIASGAEADSGSADDLVEFFASCDRRESGREPDWETHRAIIERSFGRGASPT